MPEATTDTRGAALLEAQRKADQFFKAIESRTINSFLPLGWICSEVKLRKNYFFESGARLSREIGFPSTKTLSMLS
jgi:hypothetical protein